jgi:anaphase-promoting complex subunit 4
LDTFNSQSGWIFKTPVSHFTTLLELVKNLRLLSHTTLSYVNDERRLFHAFSKWLRYEIDFEATEPDSQSRLEMEARDPGVDVSSVLEYIRYCLTRSDLTPYFLPEEQLNDDQRRVPASSYEDTRKAIELLKEEAEWKKEALCMEFVLRHFGEGCTTLFQQISQWQEDNVSMDCGVVLEDEFQVREEDGDGGKAGVMDMRMVFEASLPFLSIHSPWNYLFTV